VQNVRTLLVAGAGAVSLAAGLVYAAWGQQPAPTPAPAVAPPASSVPMPYGQGYYGYYTPTDQPGREWSAKEAQFERESLDLARQIARTESRDEKDKLRARLAEVLREQFEAQQKRRQAEIDAIEERLKKLREMMRKRDDAKRDIIQRRQEQLLQEAEGLGWSSPGAPGLTPAGGVVAWPAQGTMPPPTTPRR
jgi:hypothetical protein